MKKILSLLALLMVAFTTAWADDVKVTWTTGESGGFDTAAEPATAATDIKYTVGAGLTENGTSTFDGMTYTKFDQNTGSEKGNNGKHDQNVELGKYVDFTFTPVGGDFTPTKVSFNIVKNGTGDPSCDVDVIDGSGKTIAVASNKEIIRNNADAGTSTAHSYDVSGAESSDGAVTLRIIIGKLASGKSVGIANVVIEGTLLSADAPVLNATKSVLLKSFPLQPTATATIALTGKNLTDGTYNAPVPTSEGLTISPATFTVAEGVVNQEFTLKYEPTADAAATENLTFTVAGMTATTEVAVQARIAPYEQTIVSEDAAWDWETLAETVELKEESVPSIKDEFVFKELEDQINFGEFDAQSIVISKAQYPVRSKKFQNGTIKFTTNRPGVITVDFSDTGSSGDDPVKRYLNVNGKTTEYYTQRDGTSDRKVSGEIAVPAGEVSITGWDPEAEKNVAIVVYKVTFTPTGDVVEPGTATFDFTSADIRENIGTAMTDTKGYIYNETFTAEDVTLQITAGSAPSRIYVDGNRGQNLVTYKEYTTLTFRAPEGKSITKIEFTAAGNSNINNFTASSGTIEGMTWTGNAEGIRFAQGGTSYLANAIITLGFKTVATEALPAIEYTEVANIAAFNALEAGTYAKLTLTDAEVIGKSADGYSTVFVQDATGGAWIQYTSLNDQLKESTKLNGTIYAVKRVASGNPQIKEAEDTPKSKITAEEIGEYTIIEGKTIAEVNTAENLNRVVKLAGAKLEETSATAGKLTIGEETIDVNNGADTANQQLHKIDGWEKDAVMEDVTIVAILVAKNATANQLLPISIDGTISTGISTVNAAAADTTIYTLQGVRMNQLQKGVNIVNGKKIVVK